eukprot:3939456-Rhodomonas_salina.1
MPDSSIGYLSTGHRIRDLHSVSTAHCIRYVSTDIAYTSKTRSVPNIECQAYATSVPDIA